MHTQIQNLLGADRLYISGSRVEWYNETLEDTTSLALITYDPIADNWRVKSDFVNTTMQTMQGAQLVILEALLQQAAGSN